MAYSLTHHGGYLSHGPTIQGLKALKELVAKAPGEYLALEDFIENGGTLYAKEMAAELEMLKTSATEEDTKAVILHLAEQSRLAKGFIALGY